ncbi:MAG: hypothetical protein HZB91_09060 [Elusimicrobia bacterium]|nr:hypothetical protein [Elusimicrobiota bacterium]
MTKDVSFQRSTNMAAAANVAAFLATAAGAPITCGCSIWSETSRWWVEVCVEQRCKRDDPEDCRCLKRERVDFERQDCQGWRQNICSTGMTSLSVPQKASFTAASEPVRPAFPPTKVTANSCVCAREVEYDSSIIRCGTRYRYKGWDWTYDHPNGTSSCYSNPIRMRECVEWRGPGC